VHSSENCYHIFARQGLTNPGLARLQRGFPWTLPYLSCPSAGEGKCVNALGAEANKTARRLISAWVCWVSIRVDKGTVDTKGLRDHPETHNEQEEVQNVPQGSFRKNSNSCVEGTMSNLRLHLFGPPHVEVGGSPTRLERRKAMALLAFLAVTGPEGSHSRETLAALFWPEAD
jgi:hypothetical protein